MRRLSAFVLHATAPGIMAWAWFSHLTSGNAMVEFVRTQKGGHFQFLTNHGLFFAWSYMVVSLFCDALPSIVVVRRLKKTLLMVSMPMAFVISSIYWSLLLFFPHLIIPRMAVSRPPLPIDLALHLLPLVTLLIDFFVFESKFPKSYVYREAPAAVVFFSVWYASLVEYCASFNGFFPYPFLTHSSFPVRILIYTITAGIALGCFSTLNALHARWSTRPVY